MNSRIEKYIYDNKDNIVEMLASLVSIPSVKTEREGDSIFGAGVRAVIEKTAELYREQGLETFVQKDHAFVTGKFKGNDKTIGVFAHGDVVPVSESDWTLTSPFEPIVKDGFVVGRGSEDDKSGIVASIWALRAMLEAGYTPKSTLLLFTGGNEECGMDDIDFFVKECEMPDVCIVPDGSYPFVRGERGILHFWVRSDTPLTDIVDITAGEATNISIGKATATIKKSDSLVSEILAYCENNEQYEVEISDTIVLSALSTSCHAAYPNGAESATSILCRALLACPSLNSTDRHILKRVYDVVSDIYLEKIGLKTEDADFGKTSCVNTLVKTDNKMLSLHLDTRYVTECTGDELVARYNEYFTRSGFTMTVESNSDGYLQGIDDPFVSALMTAWTDVTGEVQEPRLSGGGTYSRKLKNSFSTGTALSVTPPIPLPEGHGAIHQPDETLDIEGFLKGIQILTHMLIEADKTLQEEN